VERAIFLAAIKGLQGTEARPEQAGTPGSTDRRKIQEKAAGKEHGGTRSSTEGRGLRGTGKHTKPHGVT
jgi:hypothetical protein